MDWLKNFIGGGSEESPSTWGDAFKSVGTNFLEDYLGIGDSPVNAASVDPRGQSYLRDSYLKSSSPSATAVTGASGSTGTLGDDVAIFNPPPFVALKDNPEPAQQQKQEKDGFGIKDVIGIGLGFLCDIRTKTDIAPLETTEVNDDLAQVAFFVKELRECY
jgi:hypothetical protein